MRQLSVAFILTLASTLACAQAYPTKPIRLIVPYPPGAGTDIIARTVGQKLGEVLGQQVVVDNRGGGGGVIGSEIAAHSRPDGYTFVMGTASNISVRPLVDKVPFDPLRDFTPIIQTTTVPLVLSVHPSLPVKTVKEFLAYAKSKPGELNYASAGTGSVAHLAGVMLLNMTGIQSTHIPYKGGAANILAVAGGEAQWLAAPIGSTIGQIRAGRIRGLGVGGSERSSFMPELPTINEAGVPGYQFYTWNGLMAPAATPRAIIDTLHAAIMKAVKMQDVREQYVAAGVEVRSSASPEAFARFIVAEQQKMRNIGAAGGLKPE